MTDTGSTIDLIGWNLDNSYAQLPEGFFASVAPSRFPKPELVLVNRPLATELGLNLDLVNETTLAAIFAGQDLPEAAQPIAQAYAGHQFGGFTMLGDGRAHLLGEQITPAGERFDIQFKGSGRTPFSRGGDGLAALGPMLREYLISESMHALGIPTTRSLAVATTGENVFRETALQGAVLTRVASSHIRVGTFQYAAARQSSPDETTDLISHLSTYTRQRHYPEISETGDVALSFLRAVMRRQSHLIAQWLAVGFVHGVMNTDNMSIAGETIDYGPCAFMDVYDPNTVFSSIDHASRYAYGNQPSIAQWNLARFAETLLPLLHPQQDTAIEIATEAINEFPDLFADDWLNAMRRKIGLEQAFEDDRELIESLLSWMAANEHDFTNTFDTLSTRSDWANPVKPADVSSEIKGWTVLRDWIGRWQNRLQQEGIDPSEAQSRMRLVNPCLIPRNHRVEEALQAATKHNDLTVFERLLTALAKPFDRDDSFSDLQTPPPTDASPYVTYCGT